MPPVRSLYHAGNRALAHAKGACEGVIALPAGLSQANLAYSGIGVAPRDVPTIAGAFACPNDTASLRVEAA